jgi:4-amino-4-deoxy-L-arabinose transferase-like glycosyltransferase
MSTSDCNSFYLSSVTTRKLRIAKGVAGLLFCIFGGLLVRNSVAAPVSTWMHIYRPQDFGSYSEIWYFLKSLRVPIPPVIGIVELVTYQVTGTTELVTQSLYRVGMVLSYLLVIYLSASSVNQVIASFLLSLIFLSGTVVIHPPNPQIYDILYPLTVLMFLWFLRRLLIPLPECMTWFLALATGFSLAMAELMRPFFLFILPICIIGAYIVFRRLPVRYFVGFLFPIVMLSGVWHFHLAVSFGQLTWSNHSGFNLVRAWPMVEIPPLVAETQNAPLGPDEDQWQNLNTAEHAENSRRLQAAVIHHIITHPINSFNHMLLRVDILLSARTSIYQHNPESDILGLYKLAVRLASGYLLLNSVKLVVGVIYSGENPLLLLGIPDNLLIIITVGSVGFLAIGDSYEEARFLISILPLLATIPFTQVKINKPALASLNHVSL